jgi:hypothetical protein
MKNLRTITVCVSILLYSLCTSAQNVTIPINEPDYNKPMLFSNLPDKISVNITEINSMFSLPVGREVNLQLSDQTNLQFTGAIVASVNKYANTMQSIVIRSSNYNGARFTLSKVIADDGTVTYIGRIISFLHGDVFELQTLNNELVLVKRKFYDLVNE